MFVKVVLVACLLGLSVAGRDKEHNHGRRHGFGGRGHNSPKREFNTFLETAKECITAETEKSDMSAEQRKAVLDMVKPMDVLQREHRNQCHGPGCGRQHRHTMTPPFKCSAEGEVVPISPAEVYSRGLVKHIDASDKITEKDQAKKVVHDALPCMEKVFKDSPDSKVPEEITGTSSDDSKP